MIIPKKFLIVTITLLCLLFFIPLVSAETLTEDLGADSITSYNNQSSTWVGTDTSTSGIRWLIYQNVENTENPFSVVRFMDGVNLDFFDVGAPPSASTTVSIRKTSISGIEVGTGTIGYQRTYTSGLIPTETPNGFEYLIFNDDFNITGLSGDGYFYLNYSKNALYNCTPSFLANPAIIPDNFLALGGYGGATSSFHSGSHTFNKNTAVWANYIATKPSGLGITGYILKHKDQDAKLYNSRAVVWNSSGGIITSDTNSNNQYFYFNVPNPQIKVGILAPSGVYYNSTLLFSVVTPTPTPMQTTYVSTNISVMVKTLQGYNPTENALVEVICNPSTGQGYTDALGHAQFDYTPHTINQLCEVNVFKTGYQTWSESFNIPNVEAYSILVTLSAVATPTPTPISYETLILSALPDSIGLGSSTTLTVSSTNNTHLTYAGGMRTVLFYENYNLGGYSSYNIIGAYTVVNSTAWKFRPNNTAAWEYGTYNPLTLTTTPKYPYVYTYQAAVFDLNSISIGVASTDVVVNGGAGVGNLNMIIGAMDGATTSHLSNFTLTVEDQVTGMTQDYGYIAYDKTVNLPRGGVFTATSTKEGYETGSTTFTVPINLAIQNGDFGTYVFVKLFNNATKPTAGNTTIAVHVDDIETYFPIPNVQITVTGITLPKFTGVEGESASFILPQNTAFTVKAVKTGYCAVQETKNTSTNEYMYIDLYMKYGACAGVTPTHTPIPNATTPKVTITPLKYGTQTQAFCGVNMSGNATLVQKGLSLAACAGFEDVEQQRLFWAIILILVFAVILAYYAGGLGALIGAGSGAVIAIAAGLLDVWILYALILIGALIIGSKLLGGGQGGG